MRRTRAIRPVAERLWARVDKSGECWEWTGARMAKGYGYIGVGNRRDGARNVSTHRLAWELANGPIPAGMHVLHRCDNPPCCNPSHLFLGTNTDNVADMVTKGRHVTWNANLTHCKNGHEFTEENTYHHRGRRACKECRRANWRKWSPNRK